MARTARNRTISPDLAYVSIHDLDMLSDRRSLPISGRPLDFCLLAVCSCLLSLMCHQTGGVASQTARAATATPPQIDFVIKAGLATAPRQDTEISEEDKA